jgi:tetratricopeptide (TPR) repeat protein
VTPDVIAHYRVLDVLGEGGMGVVYRAHDDRLGRDVALKLLRPGADAVVIERFLREAKVASSLNHPNIVTVFEAGQAEHGHFMAMELVRGRTLRPLVGQPAPVPRVSSLVRQVAEALAVAHEAGLVHRDVKPENIMVRDDGYVKVLDFGLTRRVLAAEATPAVPTMFETEGLTILGTTRYMSPEQASGHRPGPPTDVFSLGVVFYELVTGRHPFESDSQYGVLHAILAHPPVSPARLNPELPGWLDTLLLRMLDKDPNRRPTARQIATELAQPSTGNIVQAPTSLPSRYSVGRSKPRVALRRALEHVKSGHGLLFCLSGEAGIGKSTLAEDFLTEEGGAGRRLYIGRGRCSERLAGAEAYLPLLDALGSLLTGDDGSLARLMKATAPMWYDQIAPPTPSDPYEAARSGDTPRGTQERRKRELVAFLSEACRTRPMILYFDDVHWVDVSTVDTLAYLSKHFATLPLLILVTYRTEELLAQKHPFLALKRELQTRGSGREAALEFLTREDIGQYVALRFARHRLPDSFIEMLHVKTEGSPLFVADVLSYLVDQKVIGLDGEEWVLTRPVPDIARELPESIRGMIQQKIDALDDADRQVLVAASVEGPEFDAAIVARALRWDPVDVETRLDQLDQVHALVRRVREHELPDRTLTLRYVFVHVLYQNMLSASLTPARKVSLNRAVAQALVQVYGEKTAEISSLLGVLFEVAREYSLAADYFQTAASRARDIMAYREAFILGRRALDSLHELPDSEERRRRELAMLLMLGLPVSASQGFSNTAVRTLYERARVLCREFNETHELGRVLYGLVQYHIVRLQLENAREAGLEILRLAEEADDASLRVHGINVMGMVAYYGGAFEVAARHYEGLRVLGDAAGRRSIIRGFGYDPVTAALCYTSWSHWCLGYPDRALREVGEALDSAREVEHLYAMALALNFACTLAMWRGEWTQAAVYNERMMQISREEGFSFFGYTAVFHDGAIRARQEPGEGPLARMREGLEALWAIDAHATPRRLAAEFAEHLARSGRLDEGLQLVTTQLDSTTSDRFWEAELLRVQGELLSMRGDATGATEAEQCFERALGVARQQHARAFELRAATSLARLLHGRGASHKAADHLGSVYDTFTEGLDTADLVQAGRLLMVTRGGVT